MRVVFSALALTVLALLVLLYDGRSAIVAAHARQQVDAPWSVAPPCGVGAPSGLPPAVTVPDPQTAMPQPCGGGAGSAPSSQDPRTVPPWVPR